MCFDLTLLSRHFFFRKPNFKRRLTFHVSPPLSFIWHLTDYLGIYDNGKRDVWNDVYESTATRFYFPTESLPKDDYFLAFAFYIDSSIMKYWDVSGDVEAGVELGPHLISVTKIEAEDEVCDATVVDDDYVAMDIFWG